MGLDGLELIMDIEETFGIDLTDEEATGCVTPRMVVNVVFSKLRRAEQCICRSQRVFYIIRRTLLSKLGLKRSEIRPDSAICDLVPASRQKEVWANLAAALAPRKWPALVRPLWMSRLLVAAALTIFGVTVLAAICLFHRGHLGADWAHLALLSAIGGAALAGLFEIVTARLTRPFCLYVPAHLQSIRDVIPYAVTSGRISGWTREDVSAAVKRLVIEQFKLAKYEYTEDLRFAEDLQMH